MSSFPPVMSPGVLKISRSALIANYQALSSLAQPAEFMPVLKSNAYGHGLEVTYSAIAALKPKFIAIAYPQEGEILRKLGFEGRLLLLTTWFQDPVFAFCEKNRIEMLATSREWLGLWEQAHHPRPRFHLKIDTGLSRQGVLWREMDGLQFYIDMKECAGICTHFADLEDTPSQAYARLQLKRFEECLKALTLPRKNPHFCVHTASSAATMLRREACFDFCRVGIALYGLWPSPIVKSLYSGQLNLEPVVQWESHLSLVKNIRKGDFVGYGCTYQAPRDMTVGIVPLGYFDGIPRLASPGAGVLVDGRRCPLVGRVSMNMMICDLGNLAVQVGAPVTLLGSQGSGQIQAEDWAQWTQTIHYEFVSRLGAHLTRTLID